MGCCCLLYGGLDRPDLGATKPARSARSVRLQPHGTRHRPRQEQPSDSQLSSVVLEPVGAAREAFLVRWLADMAMPASGPPSMYSSAAEVAGALNAYADSLAGAHLAAPVSAGAGVLFTVPPEGDHLVAVLTSAAHLRFGLGCALPVEVLLGPGAAPGRWALPPGADLAERLLTGLQGVTLRALRPTTLTAIPGGNKFLWKLMAMLACPFETVLLVDSDNIPLADPRLLFDHLAATRATALFWNDVWRLNDAAPIWGHLARGRPASGERNLTQAPKKPALPELAFHGPPVR
eukprot:jgi/Tetstr1/459345/TSEL_004740.t1